MSDQSTAPENQDQIAAEISEQQQIRRAKRARMGHLDRAETYGHILKPICGDCADKEIVTKFWHGCRKGNWGDGMELAKECKRLMEVHELPALNVAVLDAALAWTANRHAVEV